MLKDRTLRENEDIITAMNKELEGSLVVLAESGTTVAKIQSRLLSSKFLGIQVATSLEALKVLLNPPPKQNKPENSTHTSSDIDIKRPSKLRKEMSMPTLQATGSVAQVPSRLDDNDQDNNEEINGWESGSINEGEITEPDEGWGSDDTGPNAEDASNQDSESEDDELEFRPKSKAPTKSSSSLIDSTFLPSLSVGFIPDGSDDSDWSETEGKGTDLEPRKNRRGQRARRA